MAKTPMLASGMKATFYLVNHNELIYIYYIQIKYIEFAILHIWADCILTWFLKDICRFYDYTITVVDYMQIPVNPVELFKVYLVLKQFYVRCSALRSESIAGNIKI